MYVRDDRAEPAEGSTELVVHEVSTEVPKKLALADGSWGHEGDAHNVQAARPSPGLSAILRYKWSLLIVFGLLAVPAVTAVWVLMTPSYEARAEIRVRPIIPLLWNG